MTDQEQHPDMPERDNLLGLGPDDAEALRFSAELTRQESGVEFDFDQREDFEMTSLLQTVSAVSAAFDHSTETEAFERFHHRTRTHIIAELAGTPEPVATAHSMPKPSLIQRWSNVFAAAGASIATLVVTVMVLGNSAPAAPLVSNVQPPDTAPLVSNVQPPDTAPQATVAVIEPVSAEAMFNLNSLSVDTQLNIWLDTLLQVAALNADGAPIDAPLLNLLSDVTTSVTHQIENDPDSVSGAVVFIANQTAFTSGHTLQEATVATESDQPALNTAQLVSDEAVVVAARFFEKNPDRIPSVDDVSLQLGTHVTSSEDVATAEGSAP
jgi:hypothetical protein